MGRNHAHIPEDKRVHLSFGTTSGPIDSASLAPWVGSAILLVDLDAFFASVEQLDHPEWRGKPVIVGGNPQTRGVVSACSYEARTFGIHSAMPSSQAARLCPDAIWTHGHFDRYRQLSDQVMAILYDESPVLMQVSIDEAFLDVSPTRVNREHPVAIAKRIQEKVDQLGVSCSIGVGTSKAIAKVASNMEKPHGITVVYPGLEGRFLAPLPVGEMSGIGPVAQEKLARFGIRTLGDLALVDLDILRPIFGKNAAAMQDRAQGIDTPVVAEREAAKSVSNEISVATSVDTRADVNALIATMAHKVGRRLRAKDLSGTTLRLKVRYENLKIRTCQRQVPDLGTNELTWLPLLDEMLDELWHEGVKIRLVGVAVAGFGETLPVQESLFNLDDMGANSASTSSSHASGHLNGGTRGAQSDGEHSLSNATQGHPHMRHTREKAKLLDASDAIARRFGENALRFGHELRSYGNTTGTAPKNPADYRD